MMMIQLVYIGLRMLINVGNNGILPVESAKRKLTYAEIVNASSAVGHQDKIVAAEKHSEAATT